MPPRRYTKEILAPVVASSDTWADVARAFGVGTNGSASGHLKKRAMEWGIDFSHFVGKSKGARTPRSNKKTAEEILTLRSPDSRPEDAPRLKRALLEMGVPNICALCGLGPQWNDMPLSLQVDHINGQNWDNRIENLRILDPNCHTQTKNWGSRNQPRSPIKPNIVQCIDCGCGISKRSTRCKRCSSMYKKHMAKKIEWPTPESLVTRLMNGANYLQLARELGVTDNAIRGHIRRSGLDVPKKHGG